MPISIFKVSGSSASGTVFARTFHKNQMGILLLRIRHD